MARRGRLVTRVGAMCVLAAGIVLAIVIPTAVQPGCPSNAHVPLRIIVVLLSAWVARILWVMSRGARGSAHYVRDADGASARRSRRGYDTAVRTFWVMLPWLVFFGLLGLLFAGHGHLHCL